jgi:hypothetical protein
MMSSRSPSQQAQQQPNNKEHLRSSEQIQHDLVYLRDHRVCERLELLVKSLLRDQPEDPILFICRMLRESGKAGSLIRASASGLKLADRFGQPDSLPQSLLDHRTMVGGDGQDETAAETDSPKSDAAAGSTTGSPAPPPFGSSSLNSAFPAGLPPMPAGPTSSLRDVPGLGSSAVAGGASLKPSSIPSSRVGTPSTVVSQTRKGVISVDGPVTSASAAGGVCSAAPVSSGTRSAVLEREESCKSETSCFSISSVDVSEFLAEFRSAHYALFGDHHLRITKMELADVVDRVNIPLPDVRMLVELFEELDDGTGSVRFEAFLSRMSFRIQGRYPVDLVKAVYFSLTPNQGGPVGASSALARYYAESGSSGRSTPLLAQQQLQRAGSASSISKSTTSAGHLAAQHLPASSSRPGSSAASTAYSAFSAAASGPSPPSPSSGHPHVFVTRRACREEGLWDGLGIRVPPAEFSRVALQLGIPSDDEAVCHVTDFVRLVNFITGQTREEDMT